MNRIQTRALVEGAIFAAITVVIGIIRFYIPIIALISIVWSVPTILIAFRHGFKVSILSAVVSSILVSILTQPIEGLGFFISFGVPGIIMGYLIKKKLKPEMTIFLTSIVLAICSVVSIYLGMLVVGIDITKAYSQMFIDMKTAYSEALNTMSGMMGLSHEQILKTTASFDKTLEMVKLILPGGIFMSGVFLSFLNFKLTKLVLKRINFFIEDITPYPRWRLPNKWMAVVLSIIACAIFEIYFIKLPQLYAVTMNIYTIIVLLSVVLGLSVTKFFLDKFTVPKAFKGILLLLLLVALSNVTMLLGIFDMVFDFRKLRNKPEIDAG